MADAIYYPKELGDVFDRALDRCFERIFAGEKESVAFLVVMTMQGEIEDQRIAVEATEGYFEPLTNGLTKDQDRIRIYALAVAGNLVINGKERKAVLIEAGERGNDESMILAHRFTMGLKGLTKPRPVGRLELVGMRESRLSAIRRRPRSKSGRGIAGRN